MKTKTVESKGIDIMIALDISRSMMAEDIVNNYSDLAKLAIGKLMNELRGDHVEEVFAVKYTNNYPDTRLSCRQIVSKSRCI